MDRGEDPRGSGYACGSYVIVTVNDERVQVDDEITVVALLRRLGFPDKGVAVALDWTVLPRSRWNRTLSDGARLEIVTAVQGG